MASLFQLNRIALDLYLLTYTGLGAISDRKDFEGKALSSPWGMVGISDELLMKIAPPLVIFVVVLGTLLGIGLNEYFAAVLATASAFGTVVVSAKFDM